MGDIRLTPFRFPAVGYPLRTMSWLSDDDEDVEVLDDDDFMPSDQLSDMVDEMPDDSLTEEELDDMYDPTDVEDYG